MFKFTNARKVTLARTIGSLAGVGISTLVVKGTVATACPALGVCLVSIAIGHRQLAKEEKQMKLILTKSALIKEGVVSALDNSLPEPVTLVGKKAIAVYQERQAARKAKAVETALLTFAA